MSLINVSAKLMKWKYQYTPNFSPSAARGQLDVKPAFTPLQSTPTSVPHSQQTILSPSKAPVQNHPLCLSLSVCISSLLSLSPVSHPLPLLPLAVTSGYCGSSGSRGERPSRSAQGTCLPIG